MACNKGEKSVCTRVLVSKLVSHCFVGVFEI